MPKWEEPGNQRRYQRVANTFPILISIGTQVTLQGHLRDLSSRSAFVAIKDSIYLQTNDEINFSIRPDPENSDEWVEGTARISRIAKGEGFAIYFTELDDKSTGRLKEMTA
jgi:hypothetical protein